MSGTISLNLFATLMKYLPEQACAYPVEESTRVQDIVKDIGLPEDQVKLIFINGVRRELSCILKNGDRLGIFPPVGGG